MILRWDLTLSSQRFWHPQASTPTFSRPLLKLRPLPGSPLPPALAQLSCPELTYPVPASLPPFTNTDLPLTAFSELLVHCSGVTLTLFVVFLSFSVT